MSRSSAATTAELEADYVLFGLPPGASSEQIRRRYHRLARQWHPDGFAGRRERPFAEAKMKAINGAYLRIKNAPLGRRAQKTSPSWTTSSMAAGTIRTWLRTFEGEEPRVPEGSWERDCPKCGKRIQVEGCRYVYCVHCGVGFFPDREGMSYEGELFTKTTWRFRLFFVAMYLLALVLEALAR